MKGIKNALIFLSGAIFASSIWLTCIVDIGFAALLGPQAVFLLVVLVYWFVDNWDEGE